MGTFFEKVTLKNAMDEEAAVRGYIQAPAVRAIDVNALVDTGAATLVINEATRVALGLRIKGSRSVNTANNVRQMCDIAESVEVYWKDRSMVCDPLVFPSGNVLLGAIPLENMDLMVDTVDQCLVGKHGDKILMTVV